MRGEYFHKALASLKLITWPVVEVSADNHMIKHVDLQYPGSFAQPAGQPNVGSAWSRVTGYAARGIRQSIFRQASRRKTLGKHSKGGRRGGRLKIDWTKSLPREWPMCIDCWLDLWEHLKGPEGVSVGDCWDSLRGLQWTITAPADNICP